jgi:ribosomal protein S8
VTLWSSLQKLLFPTQARIAELERELELAKLQIEESDGGSARWHHAFKQAEAEAEKWKSTVVLVRKTKDLTKAEMIKALSVDVPGVPTYDAVLQLIEGLEETCIETSIGVVADHAVLASEVGGIQVLRELERLMAELRQLGKRDDEEE